MAAELKLARGMYPPLNSAHEAASVIREEYEEFWLEVKKKPLHRSKSMMMEELVQLGAMCQRAAEDLGLVREV